MRGQRDLQPLTAFVRAHEDGWRERMFDDTPRPTHAVSCAFYRGDQLIGTLVVSDTALFYLQSVGGTRALSAGEHAELMQILGLP
jgi:hypothetical protein